MTKPTISIAWGHQHALPADWTPPKWANGPKCHVCYQAALGDLQEELKQNGWQGETGWECARRVVDWFRENPPPDGAMMLINIEAAPLTLLSHRTERDGVVANHQAREAYPHLGAWYARVKNDVLYFGAARHIMDVLALKLDTTFWQRGVYFMGLLDQDTNASDGIHERIARANERTAMAMRSFSGLMPQCYFRDLRALDVHEQPDGAAPASMIQLRVREAYIHNDVVLPYLSPNFSGSIDSGPHETEDAATALAQVWEEQRRNGGREQVVVWLDASEREAELEHAEAMVLRALEMRAAEMGAKV